MIIIGLTIYFLISFYSVYYHPEFLRYPTISDYKDKQAYMQLDMGNTIAVWTNVSNTDMRIEFSGFDVEQNTTRTIDGVKCDELYRE